MVIEHIPKWWVYGIGFATKKNILSASSQVF